MTYWNPIQKYGVDAFARDLAAAGGTGLITPDLIPDEADEWIAASDAHGLDRMFLVAPAPPTSACSRDRAHCRGFVYATSHDGRHRRPDLDGRRRRGHRRRTRAVTDLPVCVGLGVATGDQAAEVGRVRRRRHRGLRPVRCLPEAADSRPA